MGEKIMATEIKTIENNSEFLKEAVRLGKELAGITFKGISHCDETQTAVIPEGMKIVDLKDYVPLKPDCKRITVRLQDIESFIDYVNEQKNENTRIFCQTLRLPYSFIAAIDFHGPNGKDPSFITHKVILELTFTDEWKTWTERDGKKFGQLEFSEFLEANRLNIVKPDGAEILEISRTLEAKKDASFRNTLREHNGDTNFMYVETTTASTPGKFTIPESFELKISPFLGIEPQSLSAYFRFRIESGKLYLFYQLIRPHILIEEVIKKTIAKIKKSVALPVYHGSF